ncbi:MAG: hypothetical protein IJ193_01935 [Bacilli bacterium]|nr:hypothetical protein [Bacilli bacterium]
MEEEIIQEPGYVPKHISFRDLEEYTDTMLQEIADSALEGIPETTSIDEEEDEEKDCPYPITKNKAIEIARPELKKKYASKHYEDGISGLYFTDFDVVLLGTGEEKWYRVEVIDGDISHIIDNDDGTTFLDGRLSDEALKELVGYVNANTGEFEYDEGEGDSE